MWFLGIGGKDTQIWITENSQVLKSNGGTYAAWIHSHVSGNTCFFSSIDLHTQFVFEQFSSDVLGCVVELGETKVNTKGNLQLHLIYTIFTVDEIKVDLKYVTIKESLHLKSFF